jgi:crotonobetainyl-CoA:carnitine CoA-transferase CaiB-like acyl-CoA transferase
MSCTEAGLTLTGPAILDYTVNGRAYAGPGHPDTNHDEYGQFCPHNIYPAQGDDEWLAIACRNDEEWQNLAELIATEWSRDEAYRSAGGRLARQDELDRLVGEWTAPQNKSELAGRIRAAGIPAAPVLKPAERCDTDERNLDWGLWPTVNHPVIGEIRVDGYPAHLSESDWAVERPAPRLGQHNEEVLVGLLGVSPDEFATLAKDGVV